MEAKAGGRKFDFGEGCRISSRQSLDQAYRHGQLDIIVQGDDQAGGFLVIVGLVTRDFRCRAAPAALAKVISTSVTVMNLAPFLAQVEQVCGQVILDPAQLRLSKRP